MLTKLFVGLTFYAENSFSKNITSFRTRFDSKYQSNPYLHLPIVPPFEMEVGQVKTLTDELIEELESFYFENTSNHTMKFTGLDVHEYKKNKILYLNPSVDEELILCQESLFSICKSYVDRNKRMKDKKAFLTIGRYHEVFDLHSAIELAQREFHEFTSLPFESICLFSKNNGIWYREADLVSFERPESNLLQKSHVSL